MGRPTVQYRTASKENYKRFCIEYPEIRLSYKEWKDILYTYSEIYTDEVIETGNKVKFPLGFGNFAISKRKQKRTKEWNGKTYINLPVDWKKSKELGKKTYIMNYHTDGYRYKWQWFKDSAYFHLSDLYVFQPSREVSRKLARILKDPDNTMRELYLEWKTGRKY